jgi:hypothetical protein
MAIDTRWEDVDQLLQRSARTKDESLAGAVQNIIEQRFQFPSADFPAYRAHANVPEVTMAVEVAGEQVAPDIVVVERLKTGETRLVMTAAVANHEMVTEAEAKQRWARFSALPDQAFYVYVPVGYGWQAKQICRKLKIRPEGFRTWRTTPRGFEVNDITGPPGAFAALMPGFVRRALATP